MLLKPRWHVPDQNVVKCTPSPGMEIALHFSFCGTPHGGYDRAITPPTFVERWPSRFLENQREIVGYKMGMNLAETRNARRLQNLTVAKTFISAHVNMESGDAS